MTLEYTGLRVINVENFGAGASGNAIDPRKVDLRESIESRLGAANRTSTKKELRNVGPSITYKLRDAAGQATIAGGFLSREEIAKGEAEETYVLKPLEQKRIDLPQVKKRGARYTPIARRQDRPDAINWFLKNHPEVPDSKIVKLIGTTKATIEQVRNRSHWNSNQIKPVDPVTIGLCTQIELDARDKLPLASSACAVSVTLPDSASVASHR